MADFQPIDVMEQDRSTSRLEKVGHNPTVQFAKWSQGGMALYSYQLGHWYDTGFQEITDLSQIPQEFLDQVAKNPPRGPQQGQIKVTAACRICGDQMNTSDLETHYLKHYEETIAQAGNIQAAADVPPPVTERKRG